MNKTLIIASAVPALLCATPAFAQSIKAEVEFSDIRNGQADSTEYKVEYSAPLTSFLNYGAQLTVKQAENEGPLGSKVSARVGPRLPTVLGFQSEAYGEIGQNLKQGNTFMFWGAGVKTKHSLYGPVSVSVGYRHREAFEGTTRLTENRINAGLGLNIGYGNSIGATYYRKTGSSRSDAIGVSLNHSF